MFMREKAWIRIINKKQVKKRVISKKQQLFKNQHKHYRKQPKIIKQNFKQHTISIR